MPAAKQRVVFAYRQAHRSAGSKIMRCDQLARIASARLGDRFAFETFALPPRTRPRRMRAALAQLRDAVVILLKRADRSLTAEQIADLRRKARAVCVDYVDSALETGLSEHADFHIAASKPAYRRLAEIADDASRVRLVSHHADPRIAWRKDCGDGRFRVGYFGDPRNLSAPRELFEEIEVSHFADASDAPRALRALRRAPMHYAVRPASREDASLKPFTKGFNAAAANANILINRDAPEIEGYLGEDYPFLIESAHPVHVSEGVRRAREAFGGIEWRDGLEQMAEIRAECSPERIAAQLGAVLSAAS